MMMKSFFHVNKSLTCISSILYYYSLEFAEFTVVKAQFFR